MEDEYQTILCHGTVILESRRDCQQEAVEKTPVATGDQKIESLLEVQGSIEAGMDSLRTRRSGEFAKGHLQPPLKMMSATWASR